MAWALKCDICGRYVDTNSNPFERILPTNSAVRVESGDYRHTYETCEGCAQKVIDLIETLKGETK